MTVALFTYPYVTKIRSGGTILMMIRHSLQQSKGFDQFFANWAPKKLKMFKVVSALSVIAVSARRSEILPEHVQVEMGIELRGNSSDSHEVMRLGVLDQSLPDSFSWCDKDGVNYCTMSRNQHIPQVIFI